MLVSLPKTGGPSVSHQRHKPDIRNREQGFPEVPFILVWTRDFRMLWRLPRRLRWRRLAFALLAASGWMFEAVRRIRGG